MYNGIQKCAKCTMFTDFSYSTRVSKSAVIAKSMSVHARGGRQGSKQGEKLYTVEQTSCDTYNLFIFH